jgi:hypothetical protein
MSSAEQPDTSLDDDQVLTSTEVTSEQYAASDEENPFGDTGDSRNAADGGSHVKIGAEAALADVSYDFGQSTVTRARIISLENSTRYFPKGFARPAGMESVLDHKENEAVVFKDFFVARLRIPSHLVLLGILWKFQVQLHQLMPNVIVQISKFIWAVTSCRGCPTANVFAQHYELHYQHKKIHLEGSDTTFVAMFGCIPFHPSRFGNHSRLTLATRNMWTSG